MSRAPLPRLCVGFFPCFCVCGCNGGVGWVCARAEYEQKAIKRRDVCACCLKAGRINGVFSSYTAKCHLVKSRRNRRRVFFVTAPPPPRQFFITNAIYKVRTYFLRSATSDSRCSSPFSNWSSAGRTPQFSYGTQERKKITIQRHIELGECTILAYGIIVSETIHMRTWRCPIRHVWTDCLIRSCISGVLMHCQRACIRYSNWLSDSQPIASEPWWLSSVPSRAGVIYFNDTSIWKAIAPDFTIFPFSL